MWVRWPRFVLIKSLAGPTVARTLRRVLVSPQRDGRSVSEPSGAVSLPPRIVTLDGDLDIEHTPKISRRISAAIRVSRGCAVIVDCAAVTFVESRGLVMMDRLQQRAEEAGCPLIWRGLNAQALKIIHVAGLEPSLSIEP